MNQYLLHERNNESVSDLKKYNASRNAGLQGDSAPNENLEWNM